MRKLFYTFIIIAANMVIPISAAPSPVSTLQSLYERADFKKCSRLGKSITKRKEYKKDWAKAYKYLGICQYMLKNKTSAELSFRKSVRFNSSINIDASEVLDTSVISFFKKLKATEISKKNRKNRSRTAKKSRKKSKSKKTTLFVKSNVKGTIFLNGIFAGETNRRIDSDPGKATIEITSKGFLSRKFKINIIRFAQNQFTVNLKKPKPKPVRVAKRNPKPAAVAQKRKSSRNNTDLFEDEEESALAMRDLAGEFENEKASGGSVSYQSRQQPQSVYPQPQPVYPQPVYPQPQPVYTPVPQPTYIPQPQQTPIVQSAPPPNYEPELEFASPKRKIRKKDTSVSNIDPFIKLLPFGVPQFMRGDYLMGAIVGGVQAGALYFWFSRKQQATDFEAEARTNVDTILNDPNASAEQRQTNAQEYATQANATISDLKSESQMGLIGFGVAWGAGAVEAFLNTPSGDSASIEKQSDTELAWASKVEPQAKWKIGVRPDIVGSSHIVGMSLKLDF